LAKLLGCEFEIVFKLQVSNNVADALSCTFEGAKEEEAILNMLSKPFIGKISSW